MLKKAAQRLVRALLGTVGHLLQTRGAPSPLTPGDPRIRRILVVRVDMLGDTVLMTPAIRALRRGYPHAAVDVLIPRSTAGVLAGDPDITRVLTFDPRPWGSPQAWAKRATWADALRFVSSIRRPRYDLAVSVSGDIGSILTRLTGARRRVGYAGEAYPHFMTHPVPGGRYRKPQHEVRYVLDLAEAAGGIVEPDDPQPWLAVPSEERTRIAARLKLERERLGAAGPIVAVHPGARNGKAKRWPLRHFATLCDRLVQEMDALVILTGAPNEALLSREILARLRVPVVDLTGQTTLPELVALLAESDVVVTGDSGPMHIACAVATPVVALHGPTDPALSGPTAPDALILRHEMPCSPCYDASATAECRFGNPVCMKMLTPGLVFAAVRRQLAHRRPVVTQTDGQMEEQTEEQAARRAVASGRP
jgi:lipopolysaccharide heptosyltransferase II